LSNKTRIKMGDKLDLKIIRQMCKDHPAMTFMENQKKYKWYYGQGECEHAIKVDGCSFEIGIVQKEGYWELETDFYSTGGLAKVFGPKGGKLKAHYGFTKAKVTAQANGRTCYEGKKEGVWRKLVVNMSSGGTGKPGQGQSWSERSW